MEKTKQFKTYLVATAMGLAATVGLFAYEGAITSNVDAKANPTTSLTVAKIEFGTDLFADKSMKGPLSSRAVLTNLSNSQVSYTCDSAFCYPLHKVHKGDAPTAMKLGKTQGTKIGTITFNFSNFTYKSIRINTKADENKTLLINGEAHSVTTDWSNIDLYNCNIGSNKSLTITSTKVNDPFTWISFIELHSASK